ncbi:MAG: bifunctional oligoribonuclease/PAP phosphatase NrnA [Bacteroidota bacterium]|nr:bifunctional oligoribonuclease/PAP phosphatase NrnA [Bacteroidota bacterium]MDP4205948.1 bifunctional oligoribonuclease/PAP phosphatase NrnA [Bacteroidota bacterium]
MLVQRFDIQDINCLRELIGNRKKRIVIIPHINPDGDAVGSALGLWGYLKARGHYPVVITPNDYPEYLQWMEGQQEVVVYFKQKNRAIDLIKNAELFFYLDFNEEKRTGEMSELLSGLETTKVLIDHHPNPADFTDLIFSDTSACATSELVFELIDALGHSSYISKETGEALFAGILTDTGSFSYNSSDPRTYATVGRLLELGINKDKLHSRLFDNYSARRMQLLGYALNEKMVYLPEFHTAFISLTQDELKQYNFVSGDTEGLVNYPLSIRDVCFSAIFMEKDGKIKISFRSKGSFPTNRFSSAHFNGGGHCNASGGESDLNMEESIAKFIGLLPQYADELERSM